MRFLSKRSRSTPAIIALLLWVCAALLHGTRVAARNNGQFEQNHDVVARDVMSRSPQVHAAVTAHSPMYTDEALTRYIASVGQRVIQGTAMLRKHGRTPHPSVRFTVLDTPTRNAFALPPNLIFVDRGLLLHLDSEAELAAILALELARLEQSSFALPLSANEAEELLNELADLMSPLAKTVRTNTRPESAPRTRSPTPNHWVAFDINAARAP
jgi:predicted Zn-dependent protease